MHSAQAATVSMPRERYRMNYHAACVYLSCTIFLRHRI